MVFWDGEESIKIYYFPLDAKSTLKEIVVKNGLDLRRKEVA